MASGNYQVSIFDGRLGWPGNRPIEASWAALVVVSIVFLAVKAIGIELGLTVQAGIYLFGMVALNLPHGGYEHFNNIRQRGITFQWWYVIGYLAIVAGFIGLFALAPRRDLPLLYLAGAVAVALNGWLDLVDGELAREQGSGGPAGDLLDHVLDRYADIVVVAGLAAGIERYGLGLAAVTGVLMTSYLGTQAQAVGLDRVYGGLVGRADRLALVVLVGAVAAFVTQSFGPLGLVGWLLVFFAVVGHLTAFQRFYYAYRAL